MADDFKYHIDHHVSLTPPAELVAARAVGGDVLRAAEDEAIEDALRLQRRLGLLALGDGQFRRRNELSVVYDNIDGFGPVSSTAVADLLGPRLAPETRVLAGVPAAWGRLAEDESAFLAGIQDRSTMLSLPSPGFVLALSEASDEAGKELVSIVREEVAALAAEGVAYVLLHNPVTGFLLSAAGAARAASLGLDARALLDRMTEVDSAVLPGLAVPENFRLGLDLTTSGAVDLSEGYDADALSAFVARQSFERLCVEYPAAEAGRFPLDVLPAGTVVSLGLVDVSTPEPEKVEELLNRVDKAATIVDIDDLALSTNGGFAGARPLGRDQERAKLQLVETVARYFWGNEL